MAAVNRCHGGPPVVPRAHRPPPPPLERRRPRPVPPVMSSGPPTTAPLPPQPTAASPLRPVASASASAVVSLTAPRPENQRAANEYVETPFGGRSPDQQPPLTSHQLPPPPPTTHRRLAVGQQTTGRPVRLPLPLPPPPVTKQPSAATAVASFSKEGTCSAAARAMGGGTGRPSIVCPECQRCRCASCRQPRPLPERWICDNSCLLSADAVVDYASCLCCVKALFYHCGGGSEAGSGGQTCADSPCGCHPHRRAARWGCLGAVACALPCLWLYWPLRGGKRAVELCYARHSRTGCRCRRSPQQPPPLDTPEKRLLDSGSPDSLL